VLQLELANALKTKMKENNFTQEDVQNITSVSQAIVSRAKTKNWSKLTSKIKVLCEFSGVDWRRSVNPADSHILMNALSHVWDGSKAQEKALADIIQGVGVMLMQDLSTYRNKIN